MQIDTYSNVKCSLCHAFQHICKLIPTATSSARCQVFQHRQIDTGSNVQCSLCHAFQPVQSDSDYDIRAAQGRGWHGYTDNNNEDDKDEEKTFQTAID